MWLQIPRRLHAIVNVEMHAIDAARARARRAQLVLAIERESGAKRLCVLDILDTMVLF
ncbi:hypothetical protein N9K47_00150 [bacterium]|nr:hypothetical protein [bacterium]